MEVLLRERYERRIEHSRLIGETGIGSCSGTGLSIGAVEREVLATQHESLRAMHRGGEISFSVMRDVRRELDMEHARFDR